MAARQDHDDASVAHAFTVNGRDDMAPNGLAAHLCLFLHSETFPRSDLRHPEVLMPQLREHLDL